jgi:hypothetical protein
MDARGIEDHGLTKGATAPPSTSSPIGHSGPTRSSPFDWMGPRND